MQTTTLLEYLDKIHKELQSINQRLSNSDEDAEYTVYKLEMSNSKYVYVGMTSDLNKRMQQHLSQLKKKDSLQQGTSILV